MPTARELQIENEALRAQLADRDAETAALKRDVATLTEHVKRLLEASRRRPSGHPGQGELFPDDEVDVEPDVSQLEAAEDGEIESPKEPRKKRKTSKADTSRLPRKEVRHELTEEERIDPTTGLLLVPVDEKVFDELDYQRAQITLIRHVQVIYGLPPDEARDRKVAPVTAPMPPRPLEGCAASANLLAWLIAQKYANHLPLYRQEQIFARDGLRVSRQTMCDWVLGAAGALRPIVDCLFSKIRAGPVMQLDDTPVQCQGGRGAKNFQAYVWVFTNPEVQGVVYRFTEGRASDLIAEQLGDFDGWLVGDGYSGHGAAVKKVEGHIKLGGCWAHTNRKFRDAKAAAPGTVKLFRDGIKKLYEVEREADEAELDPQARLALRLERSKPIVLDLYLKARRLKNAHADSEDIAKAINYLHRQHRELSRFLQDGRIPIDNNACERAIRPIAVGRRNWLFTGSPKGGRAAAILYTLIDGCRLAGIDLVSYLADVLVRVATHPASQIEDLLPDRWSGLIARKPAR